MDKTLITEIASKSASIIRRLESTSPEFNVLERQIAIAEVVELVLLSRGAA